MQSNGAISTKGIVWTAIVLFLVVGGIVVGLNSKKINKSSSSNKSQAGAEQSGTPEGGQVSIPVPANVAVPSPVTSTFIDSGAHGWHAVQQGGGIFIQYDGTIGLKYTSTATKDASGNYTQLCQTISAAI